MEETSMYRNVGKAIDCSIHGSLFQISDGSRFHLRLQHFNFIEKAHITYLRFVRKKNVQAWHHRSERQNLYCVKLEEKFRNDLECTVNEPMFRIFHQCHRAFGSKNDEPV